MATDRKDSKEHEAQDTSWPGKSASPNNVVDVSQDDPVLAKKITMVNDAIDEIGMTPFQWKLFFLNGFGYAADSVS